MDPAVGLVQAYLRLNGFFTVTEYPIVAQRHGETRTLTDVDLLAVRFPAAERWVPDLGHSGTALPTDPVLALGDGVLEMVIGEVKEGRPEFNDTLFWEPVVEAIIRRFGCCQHDPADTARRVLRQGRADTHIGHGLPCHIRLIAFGGTNAQRTGRFQVIPLHQVLIFVREVLVAHGETLLHTQLKDDALGLLGLVLKLERMGQAE